MKKLYYLKLVLNVLGCALLLYPAMNGITGFIEERKLDGGVELKPDTSFTLMGWWNGTWQEPKEVFLNENFGFRNNFVRFQNEIDFRLFRKGHARNLVIGKEDYLYEKDYILTYLGMDFLGNDKIESWANKIKEAQSILYEKGKTLILVLAPGKGSFYPEYFPSEYDSIKRGVTNYEQVGSIAPKNGLNFIDFSNYFRSLKGTTPYLLYPQFGMHWSQYAMAIAADSLVNYIENKQNISMLHFKWNEVELKNAVDIDYDIASGMNLLTYLDGPLMGYPKVSFEEDTGKVKPSIVVISDSFYWGIYYMGFSNLFTKSHFWYYNQEVYPEHYQQPTYTRDLNLVQQIEEHDVFMLMATEHNIVGAGWGFVDEVIKLKAEGKL